MEAFSILKKLFNISKSINPELNVNGTSEISIFLPFGFLYLKVVAYFGAAYGFGLFHLFSVAPIVISCQTCSYNRLCTELFKWGL